MPYFFFKELKSQGRQLSWVCIDEAQDFAETRAKQKAYRDLEKTHDMVIKIVHAASETKAYEACERMMSRKELLKWAGTKPEYPF
jgi:hypothetical protein